MLLDSLDSSSSMHKAYRAVARRKLGDKRSRVYRRVVAAVAVSAFGSYRLPKHAAPDDRDRLTVYIGTRTVDHIPDQARRFVRRNTTTVPIW